jgi:hypothetical protein
MLLAIARLDGTPVRTSHDRPVGRHASALAIRVQLPFTD